MPFDKQQDNKWKSSQSFPVGFHTYIYTLSQFLVLSLSLALPVRLTISHQRCLSLRLLISEAKLRTQLPVHLGGCARLFLSVLSFSWANTLCSLPVSAAWEMALKRKRERGKDRRGLRMGIRKAGEKNKAEQWLVFQLITNTSELRCGDALCWPENQLFLRRNEEININIPQVNLAPKWQQQNLKYLHFFRHLGIALWPWSQAAHVFLQM